MNISIRNHIIDNFKESSINDFKDSINDSIDDKDEVTLPGLGVFFELLWKNSSDKDKNKIIKVINDSLKAY